MHRPAGHSRRSRQTSDFGGNGHDPRPAGSRRGRRLDIRSPAGIRRHENCIGPPSGPCLGVFCSLLYYNSVKDKVCIYQKRTMYGCRRSRRNRFREGADDLKSSTCPPLNPAAEPAVDAGVHTSDAAPGWEPDARSSSPAGCDRRASPVLTRRASPRGIAIDRATHRGVVESARTEGLLERGSET